MTTVEGFMRRVEIQQTGDLCWRWMGSLKNNGYGQCRHNGPGRPAHRVAYQLFIGPVPDGMEIDHTCHDRKSCPGGLGCPHRACVNPFHLKAVTHRENIRRSLAHSP